MASPAAVAAPAAGATTTAAAAGGGKKNPSKGKGKGGGGGKIKNMDALNVNPNRISGAQLDSILKEAQFDGAVQQKRTSSSKRMPCFIMSLTACAFEAYLFTTPTYSLSLFKHGIFLGGVAMVSAMILASSQAKVASKKEAFLIDSRTSRVTNRGTKGAAGKKTSDTSTILSKIDSDSPKEALAYSLFVHNLGFFIVFCILAIGVVPSIIEFFVDIEELRSASNEAAASYLDVATYAVSQLGAAVTLYSLFANV